MTTVANSNLLPITVHSNAAAASLMGAYSSPSVALKGFLVGSVVATSVALYCKGSISREAVVGINLLVLINVIDDLSKLYLGESL